VLLVCQRNSFADSGIYLFCNLGIPNCKQELFWCGAWKCNQRQFALPGFANPTFVGYLLKEASPFAG
jgi:hypothetical protein